MEHGNINSNKKILRNNLIILAILVIIFGGWILISNLTKQPSTSNDRPEDNTNSSQVTESDMENLCQDAAVIGKYMTLNEIAIVSALNYDDVFMNLDKTKDDSPVYLLKWNGKNKNTDELIAFSCYASGSKDNLKMLYLSANNVVLFGSLNY